MRERVFVDSSAWIAHVNRGDRDHARVTRALDEWAGRVVTSNFVFSETVTLCLYRFGHAVAVRVGESLLSSSSVELIRATTHDEAQAWSLLCTRRDQKYSFVDCTSFGIMRRLGMSRAVALDDDFRREGFEVLP